MKWIAIVDDDVYIGDMLQTLLTRAGYGVLRAFSGTEALLLLQRQRPDLVLLDLMLPGLSGEAVLPMIADLPVIVISAKVDVRDKVDLLMGGASDYMTKPFDPKELLARVAVQLRERRDEVDAPLRHGALCLDERTMTVTAGEQPVRLTRTEYAILHQLMRNARQVVTRSQLLDRVWQDTPDCTEGSLKVHISHLRAKLRAATGQDCIEAVWGIGLKLRDPPPDAGPA